MSNESTPGDKKLLSQIHGEKCWPMVDKLSPCEEACPLHTDVPSYIVALSQGKFKEALDVIRETNPFPYICGIVCHHPCEEVCTRAMVDEPVAIRDLKRFAGQYQEKNGLQVKPIARTKEEKVAVIGSGPAGLTAAHDLIKQGYGVSVYEALPVAGGMLAAGIPDFILPKRPVEMEINYIRSLGVKIKTNMRLGDHITIDELKSLGYRSILLATGAWKSLELPIPGADRQGVLPALDFLRDVKLGKKIKLKGRVIVIGGGNTALDAARTALRLGADNVVLTCLEARDEMPSFDYEIAAAEAEGVEIKNSLAPQEFSGRVGGRVKQVSFKKVASFNKDDAGRISWTLDDGPDSESVPDVNTVIVAIGQAVDSSFLTGVDLSDKGTVRIDGETMSTNLEGLFAAGDIAQMPGTVVEAIANGHKAARSICSFLQGGDSKAQKQTKEVFKAEEDTIPDFLHKKDRWGMPSIAPKDAIRFFDGAELGYTEWQTIEEAKRCMNCRMCGNCVFGKSQICFETSTRLIALK